MYLLWDPVGLGFQWVLGWCHLSYVQVSIFNDFLFSIHLCWILVFELLQTSAQPIRAEPPGLLRKTKILPYETPVPPSLLTPWSSCCSTKIFHPLVSPSALFKLQPFPPLCSQNEFLGNSTVTLRRSKLKIPLPWIKSKRLNPVYKLSLLI